MYNNKNEITWDNIENLNSQIIPSSINIFKFEKNNNYENKKNNFLDKKKIDKDLDYSPLFFDPFLDIVNKKKMENVYKKKKNRKKGKK